MTNTGFGLRLVGTLSGRQPLIREYYVPATYGTALYQGDAVMLLAGSNTLDPNNEVPVIAQAVSGDVILGVIVGFRPSAALPYTGQYNPASTARYVEVCDDPEAIYEIQEDGASGVVTAAQVGAMNNFNLNVQAGSTVTGLSGTMLQSSSHTTSAADLKVVGVRRDGLNAVGSNYYNNTGAVLQVKILSSAVNATASHS